MSDSAFKNFINPALIADLAAHLRRVHPCFPESQFVSECLRGLGGLELKQRVSHVAEALARALPADFEEALVVLKASLAPARLDDDLSALSMGPEGVAGWAVWPMTEFVARQGLAHPEASLRALHALTQRFSAEFAIRPFLAADPDRCLPIVQSWLGDPSPHVRRLASEGTRSRLPWGMRLEVFIREPRRTLPILEALYCDPSAYVRRSVANHLNDLSKDHPALALETAASFLRASPSSEPLVRHALRSLVKQGNSEALALLGFGSAETLLLSSFCLKPKQLRIGEAAEFSFELRNKGADELRVVLDYAVHFARATGRVSRKVFKGRTLSLPSGASVSLSLRHHFRDVSIRRHHPGLHRIEVLVNGSSLASGDLRLRA